jgi:hypothetical protein
MPAGTPEAVVFMISATMRPAGHQKKMSVNLHEYVTLECTIETEHFSENQDENLNHRHTVKYVLQ